MDYLERLKNLMIMAAIDRKLTDEEMELLLRRSRQWQIDPEEFAAAMQYASDEEATLTLPDDHQERLGMLREMMQVMVADGELAELEKQMFAVAAAHMGVTDAELDQLIDSLT
jgi:uncharacterized tellurite resistance protein B-like protein